MQWLIDIVTEWIQAQGYALEAWVLGKGYLTTSFVDRGDPPSPDFDKFDLVDDSSWRELDLSGIVPSGVKAVSIHVVVWDDAVNKSFSFRTPGHTFDKNKGGLFTQVAHLFFATDMLIILDANRKIEYFLVPSTWFAIGITVKGWWL